MSNKIINTNQIRNMYSYAYAWRSSDDLKDGDTDLSNARAYQAAEFDEWLRSVKQKVWYEGFDAGERDVWEHQHGEAGWDSKCIENPYLKEDNE